MATATTGVVILTRENVDEHIKQNWKLLERFCARGYIAEYIHDTNIQHILEDVDTPAEAHNELRRILLEG